MSDKPQKTKVFTSELPSVRERRKQPRFFPAQKFQVVVTPFDADANELPAVKGFMTDYSPAGMGAYVTNKILIGSTVKIMIKSQDSEGTLMGEIVWCKPLPEKGHIIKETPDPKWFIGVQLKPETKEEVAFIQTLIAAAEK